MSVYVDRPDPGGLGALLTDLLKPVREVAESRPRSGAEKREVGRPGGFMIWPIGWKPRRRRHTRSLPSEADGFFMLEPLTHPVPSTSVLGPRPYLRPLRAAPRPFRTGVIVADRAQARVFISSNGLVEEFGSASGCRHRCKANYGGFSGYAEHNVRGHADEASAKMWKRAGQRLLNAHQDRPGRLSGYRGVTSRRSRRSVAPFIPICPSCTEPTSPPLRTPSPRSHCEPSLPT